MTVGEGGVWVLNTEGEQTISRIDSESGEIVDSFEATGTPAELVAGEGALWVGNAGGRDFTNALVSVSRIDPESGEVTRTAKLPGGDRGVLPTAGLPRLAVGAGAVWAINPDSSVSRIDPDSGRIVARVKTKSEPLTIAAGDEGVWFVSDFNVTHIDPRTNRVSDPIGVGAEELWGVAVGGGSVWAAARAEGLLWRIEPGQPRSRGRSTSDLA